MKCGSANTPCGSVNTLCGSVFTIHHVPSKDNSPQVKRNLKSGKWILYTIYFTSCQTN